MKSSSADRPPSAAGEVHVWRAGLDGPGWPGPGELPAQERERAAGFLRARAARRWVASRWALRRVLASYLEVPPAAVELEAGDHGKPRLRDAAGPRFNLSHSEGLALVAVSACEVGVDVEAIRPERDLVALAERALPAAEADAVRAASPSRRPALFYAAWTRHEARLKCLGSGLGTKPADGAMAVASLEVEPGYAAAVAVARSEIGPLRIRRIGDGY